MPKYIVRADFMVDADDWQIAEDIVSMLDTHPDWRDFVTLQAVKWEDTVEEDD